MNNKSEEPKNAFRDITLLIYKPIAITLDGKSWAAQSAATKAVQEFCLELSDEIPPEELLSEFIQKFVRERQDKGIWDFSDLPPLPDEIIDSLEQSELENIAKQYLSESANILRFEVNPDAEAIKELRRGLLSYRAYRKDEEERQQKKLNSLFNSSAINSVIHAQKSIDAMTKHSRGMIPDHLQRITTPPPELYINRTPGEMLDALKGLVASSHDQHKILISQEEQQVLQSESLAAMNSSLVQLAEGTAEQADKARRSARLASLLALFTLVVTAIALITSAVGLTLGYKQAAIATEVQRQANESAAKSDGEVIDLLQELVGIQKTEKKDGNETDRPKATVSKDESN